MLEELTSLTAVGPSSGMPIRFTAVLLGVIGGVVGAGAGVMLIILGQTVFLAGLDRFRVVQLGVLTIVAAMSGAFGAALGLSRVRLGAGLLIFAAVCAAASAAWFSLSGFPVIYADARSGRPSVRGEESLSLAQNAAFLIAGTGPLFLAAAGLHIGHDANKRQ
jgi:hypothetical protein